MITRELRQPPAQDIFDQRDIPVFRTSVFGSIPWFRLSRVQYPNQFYASMGSRFTPASGQLPCVYLGESKETTVAEVWGDRFAAHRDHGSGIYVIPRPQAESWAFLEVKPMPDLRVCSLLDSDTRLALGIDSGSIYAPDFSIPQLWAERIARHPLRLDGIYYRSRHTDRACFVLWSRADDPVPLEQRLTFTPAGDFHASDEAHILAGKVGIRLSFAW